jgi:hypothetical protein
VCGIEQTTDPLEHQHGRGAIAEMNSMRKFHVANSDARRQLLILRDCDGRHHVARALCRIPDVGAELHGTVPAAGFNLLLEPTSGQVVRTIFEQVDCDLQTVMSQLHL